MSKIQTFARALAPAMAIAVAVTCGGGASAASLTEDFAKVPGFASKGWTQQNNSTTPGDEPNWVQGGDGTPFTAHSGAGDSYLTVNYASVLDGDGPDTISNWLISPIMSFNNGDVVSFYTKTELRTANQGFFPDRLQLRFSKASGLNVGTNPGDVGTFTTLLLDVNPTLALQGQPGAYPTSWTQYTGQILGLNAPTNGAIAFRYFVTDGGPGGSNSNSIAVDSVSIAPGVAPVPEPAAYLMMALGLGVIGLRRMRATRG